MLLETLVMEEMLREWLTIGHGRLVAGLVTAAMLLESWRQIQISALLKSRCAIEHGREMLADAPIFFDLKWAVSERWWHRSR
jgi:hypothetical protein